MQHPGGREDGQSEVLGTILLAALIVLFVGLVGSTVFLPLATEATGPTVDVGVSVTPGAVNVSHHGGDRVAADALDVVVQGPSGRSRFDLPAGFPGPTFAPGDTAVIDGRSFNPGDEVRVLVIHAPSNELIYDGRKFARFPPTVGARLVWSSTADWDAGRSVRVVHDDVGDRVPTRLQLGYGAGGPSAPGLVSYYPLDGSNGVVVRDATGLNDGTLKDDSMAGHDAYDRGVSGVWGGSAIRFEPQKDGISYEKGAYVDIGSRTASRIADGSFTWTAWIRTGREGGGKEAVVSANGADRSNNILWFLCKPGCTAGDDSPRDSRLAVHDGRFHRDNGGSDGVINDGNWHHIAVTLNDSTGRVTYYVDGTAVHGFTTSSRIAPDDVMSLGQDSDNANYGFGTGTSDFLEGTLDEVRVYDRVLSPAEIARLERANGTYVTDVKRFVERERGDALRLEAVDTDPGNGSVTVYVEADPDGDGTFENRSDAVALDATTQSYAVEFPGTVSASRFRLRVEMTTARDEDTPTVDRIDLAAT
ncbi:MAG: LamG domain-containing protein [Haloarculaceae archaeon]